MSLPETQYLTRDEEFRGLRAEWAELLATQGRDNIFSSWEWNYSWWRSYRERIRSAQLLLIAFRRSGQLIGLVPAYLTGFLGGWRTLRLLGDQFETTLYADFLLATADVAAAAEWLQAVNRRQRIRFWRFRHVLSDATCQQIARRVNTGLVRPSTECPYVPLPATFAEYLGTRRRDIQKDRQKLFGPLGARIVDLTSVGVSAIERLFALHEQNFASRQKTTGFRQAARLEFHRQLLELLQPQQRVYLLGVEHDGELVAVSYGFRSGQRSVGYQLGYDVRYRKQRLGFQLILNDIEWAIGQGLHEHDLSAGGGAYKAVYSQQQRELEQAAYAWGPGPRLALAGLRNALAVRDRWRARQARRAAAQAERSRKKDSSAT